MKELYLLILLKICRLLIHVSSLFQKKRKTNCILILSHNNLGDIVCDSCSMQAIRRAYPKSHIVCLVRRSAGAELLQYSSAIDEVLVIPPSRASLFVYYRFAKSLTKYSFSASFQLVRVFEQWKRAYIPYLCGIPNRYGIMDEKYKNHSKHHCFTKQIYEDLPRNRVEESLDVLRLAGVVVRDIQLKCWTSNTMYNIPEKYVIVHPGADLIRKTWPTRSFVKIISNLEKDGHIIIVTGVPKEKPLLEKMNAEYVRLYGHPLDIRDNLSIDNFLYIIQHAQLVITNDTGPMHFAISFHTPVIAIFGPTPPNYAVDKNRSPSLIAMRAKAVCPGSNKCTIFNSMDKERAEEIRQICNKKNQICTDMITVESVTCVAQRVLSASCFSIS